jgi:lipoyl(octanoyl) transferase
MAERGAMSKLTKIAGVEWHTSAGLTDYAEALAAMESRVSSIAKGEAAELIWLLEHPPLYTAGTSAKPDELIDARFPVHLAGRGGRYTYHGPGQRVCYVMLDLNKRGRDIRCFVHHLEGWMIAALDQLGVKARRAPDRIGLWTDSRGAEAKIGAIGVRVRKWVSFHGFAINVAPDLSHFEGIIPCGLPDFSVTSMRDLGQNSDLPALDLALSDCFPSFLKKFDSAVKNA